MYFFFVGGAPCDLSNVKLHSWEEGGYLIFRIMS